MARLPTTADPFSAIGEPLRREVLNALGTREASVSELVERLRLPQPQVSKHLSVLRAVDLVTVRNVGKHHLYRVNGPALKPIYDWAGSFERIWNGRLDRLDNVLTEMHEEEDRP